MPESTDGEGGVEEKGCARFNDIEQGGLYVWPAETNLWLGSNGGGEFGVLNAHLQRDTETTPQIIIDWSNTHSNMNKSVSKKKKSDTVVIGNIS